jgi:hypothetical protein
LEVQGASGKGGNLGNLCFYSLEAKQGKLLKTKKALIF